MLLGQPRQSPSDRSCPCAWHDVCPAVSQLQLPPADDRRDRGACICQVTAVDASVTLAQCCCCCVGDSLVH